MGKSPEVFKVNYSSRGGGEVFEVGWEKTLSRGVVGRRSSGEKGLKIGEENQDLKEWGWGRISCCREIKHPCN